jgi:hypothetical protein
LNDRKAFVFMHVCFPGWCAYLSIRRLLES